MGHSRPPSTCLLGVLISCHLFLGLAKAPGQREEMVDTPGDIIISPNPVLPGPSGYLPELWGMTDMDARCLMSRRVKAVFYSARLAFACLFLFRRTRRLLGYLMIASFVLNLCGGGHISARCRFEGKELVGETWVISLLP